MKIDETSAGDSDETPGVDPAIVIRLQDIGTRLSDVSSLLDDLMFDILREASRKREGRPALDKTLGQARRAIEKAIHLLDIE